MCRLEAQCATPFINAPANSLFRLLNRLKSFRTLLAGKFGSPTGKRVLSIFRAVLGLIVVWILVKQLSTIGWKSLISNMPRTPWFYVTIAVMYVTLPIFETSIYGRFFEVPRGKLFSVFVRKKILNSDFMGYSGDLFVLYWIRDRLGIPEGKVFRFMVDNGITSSLGAFSATGVMFGFLILTDSIRWGDFMGERDPMLLVGVLLLFSVLGIVGFRFRNALFSLPGKSVLLLYAAHFARFTLNFGMQILQWWVVMPFMPFDVWGTMLAIVTISNRLPFIPAKDLLAVSVILGVSGVVEGSSAAISAMMLTRFAIDRLLNLSFFIPLSLTDRKSRSK